jgi:hypothetical protein
LISAGPIRRIVLALAVLAGTAGSALSDEAVPLPPGPKPPVPGSPADALRLIEGTTLATFAPKGWGYSLELPADWLVLTPEAYTVVISGPRDTEAFYAPIGIQNRKAPFPGDPAGSAEAVLTAHLETMRGRFETLQLVQDNVFRPPEGAADGARTDLPEGRQIVVEWRGESGVMRQWAVARARPDAPVVHLWTYTADRALFDVMLPEARAVLDGWSLMAG